MISQLEETSIVSALLAFATDKWGTSTVELQRDPDAIEQESFLAKRLSCASAVTYML